VADHSKVEGFIEQGGKLKKSLILLFVLLLSVAGMAQVRTGNISGVVTDTQGTPIPGVSVTLRSSAGAPNTVVTDDMGVFRFVNLVPSSGYSLTAELQGFKKQEKTGIIVVLGQNSKIDIIMEQGALDEQVTVIAVTPTVDAKKTSVGKNVSQEILQSLPTSRDPWNVMQMAPGIIMDRENVGGTESGQQASYIAKGGNSANGVWAVDGVVVTDPAAIGASPTYWDFDSFDEMNVVTGGADVTIQTGGVALNMITRRGGNKVSFGGRFYLTDSQFQAKYSDEKLAGYGLAPGAYNKINTIKDYGFNVGGPLIKDKAWLWGSYGVQDIKVVAVTGGPIIPLITDYNFKLNLQVIPSNRFEALYIAGAKVFQGRSISQSYPEGNDQGSPYHFGNPIFKMQDEQMFGNNLLVSAKFAYMDAAFQFIPHSDPNSVNLVQYDYAKDIWHDNWFYITTRPMYDYNLNTQYYNDKLFGVSHEIKLGVEYSTRRVTTNSSTPGNFNEYYDLNYADIDPTGTGNPVYTPGMTQINLFSQYNLDYSVKQLTAFLQDTVTTGRLNVLVGLRYDHQQPQINPSAAATVNDAALWTTMYDPDVKAAIKAFMPGVATTTIKPDFRWNTFSPRLGITYDLFGTGKTVLKLSGAIYGDFMGTGSASYLFAPYGVFTGWMSWYWLDGNGDGVQQAPEMFVSDPTTYAPIPLFTGSGSSLAVNPAFESDTFNVWWGGFTPGSTVGGAPSRYLRVDQNAASSRTWEMLFSVDHELMTDFSVGLNATWRKYDKFSWNPSYYANGTLGDYSIDGENRILDFTMYEVAGQIPTDDPTLSGVNLGQGAGRDYWLRSPEFGTTPYYAHVLNTNYETYWGVDLVFNKRLSNKWMMDGSLSYMDQKYHYGDGYQNPSNLWAQDNQLYAPALGSASGKINQYLFSHWMLKLEGLYQLPYDFNVSFTFNARAGHVIPHYMTVNNRGWANAYNRSIASYLDVFGTDKLPTFYQMNFRLEKLIKLGDMGKIYLMADVFNLFNSSIVNRRYDRNEGTYNINANGTTSFAPYANNYRVNELLNPRVTRLGVRFQF
jgi:hypothetical protein